MDTIIIEANKAYLLQMEHSNIKLQGGELEQALTTLPYALVWGALFFGLVIGWNLYYVNRHRTGGTSLTDLVTLISAVGGGAILAIFPSGSKLFGYYGIGLGLGFLLYFLIILIFASISKNFGIDWFLDGRKVKPKDPDIIVGPVPMHVVSASQAADEP